MAEHRRPDTVPGLTGVLADIGRLVGAAATIKFAARHGGRQFHIPRPDGLREDHPLMRALGRQAAGVVAAALGGRDYRVPTGRTAITQYQIRQLLAAGWPVAVVARRLCVHPLTVQRIARHAPAPRPGRPQPITLRCLCCGRSWRLAPDPPAVLPPQEDDAAFLARQPPLLRLAVDTGAMTIDALRHADVAARRR